MNYLRITRENIDGEHICCAMSGKQALQKKEWLKQRLDEGLVFYRSEERGNAKSIKLGVSKTILSHFFLRLQ